MIPGKAARRSLGAALMGSALAACVATATDPRRGTGPALSATPTAFDSEPPNASVAAPAPAPISPAVDDLCARTEGLPLSALAERPPYGREDRYCANTGRCQWALVGSDADLRVHDAGGEHRQDPLPFEIDANGESGLDGRRLVLAVDDGYLVGFNRGEWGAALWWFSPDGKKRRKLSEEHCVELIRAGSAIVAATGLDHMMAGKGRLLRVSKGRDGSWAATKLADIGDSAYAATADAAGVVTVVTRTQVVRVAPSGGVRVLHTGTWDSLYPRSIRVLPGGHIYIGMRLAVAHLTPRGATFDETWLVPKRCRTVQWDAAHESCDCAAPDDG